MYFSIHYNFVEISTLKFLLTFIFLMIDFRLFLKFYINFWWILLCLLCRTFLFQSLSISCFGGWYFFALGVGISLDWEWAFLCIGSGHFFMLKMGISLRWEWAFLCVGSGHFFALGVKPFLCWCRHFFVLGWEFLHAVLGISLCCGGADISLCRSGHFLVLGWTFLCLKIDFCLRWEWAFLWMTQRGIKLALKIY